MELGESVTEWLQLWRDGDEDAMSRVTDLVYRDLRRLAAFYLNGESQANTLQPTALVHEAYLRVSQIRKIDWQNRGHFIAIVTNLMRRILVDHARARRAAKRDGALAGSDGVAPHREPQVLKYEADRDQAVHDDAGRATAPEEGHRPEEEAGQ